MRRAVAAIQRYVQAHGFPEERAILRLDGHYGTGAVVSALAGFSSVTRGKDSRLLDRAEVQARLHLPADQQLAHPESERVRALYACPDQSLDKTGQRVRIIVATHPAGTTRSRIGVTRAGVVSELFLTDLPQSALTAADVVSLYLPRGAFENALADEDVEQDPDRWCSHSAWGQEAWHIISQWVWNLRLELGHRVHPEPVRTTEFAPAHLSPTAQQTLSAAPAQGYGPATEALPWKAGHFCGRDFIAQPDGTLRCPAGQSLRVHEQRREAAGSLRVVYAASIRSCRPCPLREQCQWQGRATAKPRQVSVLLPLSAGVTGAGGFIDGRPCNCCEANAWRCGWSRSSLLTRTALLHPCPVRSERIIVSRGQSGWLAMRVPQRLVKSRSGCAASLKPLRAFLGLAVG